MSDFAQHSPEEAKLNIFVGDWKNQGTVYPGRFGPGGDSTGETTYRWEVGNKWLYYDSRLHLPGMGDYEVHGGVAYDAQVGKYRAFAFNSLGILLVYTGYWEDTRLIFDLVHPHPKKPSRVVYHTFPDNTFEMHSETSEDGINFTPYFETRFSPVP